MGREKGVAAGQSERERVRECHSGTLQIIRERVAGLSFSLLARVGTTPTGLRSFYSETQVFSEEEKSITMQVWLLIVLSSSSYCCCFSASFNNSPSSLNSSSTHFPLSIPRPLLPYFQSVNKASESRQPRQGLDKESTKSDFWVDSDTKVEVEAGTGLKLENVTVQENLGLRVPPAVREHYMKGRSGRQIVPGVFSCGHQVPTN